MSENRLNTAVIEGDLTNQECVHHWVLDQPNGPTSSGRCKHCGTKEEFRNSMQGSGWDRSGQARKAKQQNT